MDMHKAAKLLLLVVVLAFLLSIMAGPVFAADSGKDSETAKAGDKSLSVKKGLDVLEGDPKKKEQGVTTTQKIIGFGSLVVMIIVVKFV